MEKGLGKNGLIFLWSLIKGKFVAKEEGKGLSSNDFTKEDKAKLDGIDENANNYAHPTGSGNNHIPAGGAPGNILGWESDGSAIWKEPQESQLYEHPKHTAYKTGLYKVEVDELGHVVSAMEITKEDIVALGIPEEDTNTTYEVATRIADGLMAASDKAKLDEIDEIYARKSDLTNVYKYKGSVTSEELAALNTKNIESGWVYNIINDSEYGPAGTNVAWTGTDWDPLGGVLTIEELTNEEIEEICI